MTKRRERQKKRQKSREQQAALHDNERLEKALAQYRGSPQESIDMMNERIKAFDGDDDAPGPIGPDYKRKRRQKSY
jgi:iron only hydrogenase large subunit-like protein